MTNVEDLYEIEDPRQLFLLATHAINERQEAVDELAVIRAGAIAALYSQGYSYRELADVLGLSAPRIGQLIAANSPAAIQVLRSWSSIEEKLNRVARVAHPASPGREAFSYRDAIRVLTESAEVDPEVILALDSLWNLRNHLVHGRAEIDDESVDEILGRAAHIDAVLTIWLNGRAFEPVKRFETTGNTSTTRGRSLPSVDQATQRIAQLRKDEATLRRRLSDASAAAAKARATAAAKRRQAATTSSPSMARSYISSAETADKKAASEEKKIADISAKLGDVAKKVVSATKNLESANRAADRTRDMADSKRRSVERRHVQEVAKLARPTVRYVHEIRTVEPPKPEKLRVLYLTANPDSDAYLRVDVEVRDVRQAVRRAVHRDLIELDHRSAATPEDLLDGLNEQRPHVVHFSGHGGDSAILFDDGKMEDPAGRSISFDLLARALAATDVPPKVLVLNACETHDGAEVLLDSVPVVIAMTDSISDLAAAAFATRFYSSVASAQSVQSAVNQGAVAVDMLELREGWKPVLLSRVETNPSSLILVEPLREDGDHAN